MFDNWHWQYVWGIACVVNYVFMMGVYWLRRGEIVETATRQAMTVNQAKLVNAKASTSGVVTVKAAKGFRFGGSKVAGARTAEFA